MVNIKKEISPEVTKPEVLDAQANSFEEVEKTKARLFHSKEETFHIYGINRHLGMAAITITTFVLAANLPVLTGVRDAQAVVVPAKIVDVEALHEGQITALDVNAGDSVNQGQVLAKILNPYSEMEIAKARNELALVESQQDDLNPKRLYWFERLETDKRLYSRKAIAKDEYLKTELAFKTLEDNRESLRLRSAGLKEKILFLEKGKDMGIVKATISGTVISEPQIKEGTYATPGKFILSLASRTQQIEFLLHQQDYGRVKPGQQALVRFYALPGKFFRGEVSQIKHYAEPVEKNGFRTNVIKVLVRLPEFPEGIRNGMAANVTIKGRPVSLMEIVMRRI